MIGKHTKRHPIKWTPRTGPIWGWVPGHSPVQYGRSSYLGDSPLPHEGRSFVRCECEQVFSGKGESGGQRSHQRHINRLKVVHDHGEGQSCNSGCMPLADFKALRQAAEPSRKRWTGEGGAHRA
jgi:hypothetical protein